MNPFDLPGPQFLMAYAAFAAAMLIGLYLLRRARETGEAPSGYLRDPYLVACLRGGPAEVVRVATVALIDRGFIELDRGIATARPGSEATRGLADMERAVLRHFHSSILIDSVFSAQAVLAAAERNCADPLRHRGLLPDSATLRFRWGAIMAAIALIAGVALVKIDLALARGRSNIGFLIVLAVVAAIAAVMVGNPRRTAFGAAVLRSLRGLFSGLRSRADTIRAGNRSNDLLWLAAVFGLDVLPSSAFPSIERFYPRKESGSSSCGGSGGGSCGGGGGGCGGCGGGGCGGG
jgi:uncharacterized protein (TIGR04222 family)